LVPVVFIALHNPSESERSQSAFYLQQDSTSTDMLTGHLEMNALGKRSLRNMSKHGLGWGTALPHKEQTHIRREESQNSI